MTALEKARNAPFQVKLIGAFAAVYFVWGSTYLAIHLVMKTLPGFLAVGLRFLIAGLILVGWGYFTRAQRPTRQQIFQSSFVGVLLLFVGTGGVVWAAAHLQSGLLALLVAMEPIWLTLLFWVWPGGHKPGPFQWAAMAVGFAGAAVLAAPGAVLAGPAIHLPSVLVLTIGCLAWAAGSLHGRTTDMPASPSWSSGLQMLAGGVALIVYGLGRGEWAAFQPENASLVSIGAFVYLVVFGSLIAFSAYNWLMRNVDPTMVATHTFVNPVVAVVLGWWLAHEEITSRTLIAAGLITFLGGAHHDRRPAAQKSAETRERRPSPRRAAPTWRCWRRRPPKAGRPASLQLPQLVAQLGDLGFEVAEGAFEGGDPLPPPPPLRSARGWGASSS